MRAVPHDRAEMEAHAPTQPTGVPLARAVALGYQGFGNVGDEAILAGIERLLEGSPVRVTTVIGGGRAPIPAFPRARRIVSRRLFPGLAAARAIARSDLLLVTGGGLIHDHWRTVVPKYLAWTILARMLSTKVVWIGVGVGPLRARWARWLARQCARLASLLTVRDEASAALLLELDAHLSVHVVPDPAVFIDPVSGPHDEGTAFVVRTPVPREAHLGERLELAMTEFAVARLRRGLGVTLLGMDLDTDIAARIADGVERAGLPRPAVETLPVDPGDALRRMGSFGDAVGMRLHAVLLAALAGTPCLPIAYDAKVAALADRLGVGDLALTLDELSPSALEAGLEAVGTAESTERVRRSIAELRGERERVATLLVGGIHG